MISYEGNLNRFSKISLFKRKNCSSQPLAIISADLPPQMTSARLV